jgi:hypothetical protein
MQHVYVFFAKSALHAPHPVNWDRLICKYDGAGARSVRRLATDISIRNVCTERTGNVYVAKLQFMFKVGLYELVQPDGRERLVTYSADGDSGFNANVSYQNPQGSGYMYRFPDGGAPDMPPSSYHRQPEQEYGRPQEHHPQHDYAPPPRAAEYGPSSLRPGKKN